MGARRCKTRANDNDETGVLGISNNRATTSWTVLYWHLGGTVSGGTTRVPLPSAKSVGPCGRAQQCGWRRRRRHAPRPPPAEPAGTAMGEGAASPGRRGHHTTPRGGTSKQRVHSLRVAPSPPTPPPPPPPSTSSLLSRATGTRARAARGGRKGRGRHSPPPRLVTAAAASPERARGWVQAAASVPPQPSPTLAPPPHPRPPTPAPTPPHPGHRPCLHPP